MFLRALHAVDRLAYENVWARKIDVERERGMVTFSFDDAPASAFEAGGATLERFGWQATYYLAPGLIGRETALGPGMLEHHLVGSAEAGHEIASHTYRHADCRRLRRGALVAECRKGADALRAFAPRNFAYPYGRTTPRVKRTVGPMFDSCRGVQQGINAAATDLNDLKANAIYSCIDPEGPLRLIEENKKVGGWLILYTHDVREEPSPYGTTPGDMERICAAVQSSGLRVETIRRALEELRG